MILWYKFNKKQTNKQIHICFYLKIQRTLTGQTGFRIRQMIFQTATFLSTLQAAPSVLVDFKKISALAASKTVHSFCSHKYNPTSHQPEIFHPILNWPSAVARIFHGDEASATYSGLISLAKGIACSSRTHNIIIIIKYPQCHSQPLCGSDSGMGRE